jgi:hypothetical protein
VNFGVNVPIKILDFSTGAIGAPLFEGRNVFSNAFHGEYYINVYKNVFNVGWHMLYNFIQSLPDECGLFSNIS